MGDKDTATMLEEIQENDDFRKEVAYMIAREFPKEYLSRRGSGNES